MARDSINIVLTKKSIDEAISKLQEYQDWILQKTKQLAKELANVGIPVINANMEKASYTYDSDGIRSGSNTIHIAYVELNSTGTSTEATLIVQGEEIMFIEFGAGVYYNGTAGDSPHPNGKVNGMVIGSYGKGHGVRKVWGYYDNGKLILTHGVEAQMPVYKAEMKIVQKYLEVARRVFS